MKTVKVEFEVEVPETATDKEIEDWVSLEVGAKASLAGDNPMAAMDLKAKFGSVWVR